MGTDEIDLLDELNDAALSLDGLARLVEALACHDGTNREESLALNIIAEQLGDISNGLHTRAEGIDRRLLERR